MPTPNNIITQLRNWATKERFVVEVKEIFYTSPEVVSYYDLIKKLEELKKDNK